MGPEARVVIVNWNGKAYLRNCLRTVLDQSYERAGVIVVDNGSTDGSADLIRQEFPEVELLPLPQNLHFARGTNAGVDLALRDPACRYVVTLNNDTTVDRDFLAELVRAAASDHVGMVSAKLLFMDRPGVLNTTGMMPTRDGTGLDRGWNQRDEGQFDAAMEVFAPSAGAALYRREVFETVGLFDEDFVAYCEDLDLAWRARLAGWEARFAPRAVVHHKYSASTAYQSSWKTYQGERNRIWTLVQNYPWRYVALGVPWNATRVLAQVRRHAARRLLRPGTAAPSAGPPGPGFTGFVDATLRARLDAYAGMGRALQKRRLRSRYRTVEAAEVGRWLRRFGMGIPNTLMD